MYIGRSMARVSVVKYKNSGQLEKVRDGNVSMPNFCSIVQSYLPIISMNARLSFHIRIINSIRTTHDRTPHANCAHILKAICVNINTPGVSGRHYSQNMASEFTLIKTTVLPVDATKLGTLRARSVQNDYLDDLDIELDPQSVDAQYLRQAAEQLKTSDIPVAFPTETVYGLGADATRSSATRGIYKAKQRPADNPLIVHFASLEQLRALLRPSTNGDVDASETSSSEDPIPSVYKPLIKKFWPGPLTIILPNPPHSPLAPEVTAGLTTFGARMPRHPLALALIKTSGKPIAAPSANASTKPSPTAAEHVAHDLNGRIETILDGGPCDVGVESTVVDGLSSPPLILRPGGISIEQLRECEGWENTQIGYKDTSEKDSKPKAPGMKYRHYSPKATVVLFESGKKAPTWSDMEHYIATSRKLGVIRTKRWTVDTAEESGPIAQKSAEEATASIPTNGHEPSQPGFAGMLQTIHKQHVQRSVETHAVANGGTDFTLLDVNLGSVTADIARGVFAALRDLDRQDVDAIFVEGINDEEGDVAAAVMNRLRKAAEIKIAA
jgi:L-threonylcarbamoyladenylate synthase